MSFYFPVVLTSIIRTSLTGMTLDTGMAGAAIMETMAKTIKTTVVGKGISHRQALILFYY